MESLTAPQSDPLPQLWGPWGAGRIGLPGRAEKAQPCPPLCNEKGGAVLGRRPRAHCAPRCAVMGGGRWARCGAPKPPPHRHETYNQGRMEGRDPDFSKSPAPNRRPPACCPSFALSSLPRMTSLSNLGLPNLSWPSGSPRHPTKCAVPEPRPGVGPRPHLSKHQGAAASRRQVFLISGSALGSPGRQCKSLVPGE